MSRRDRSATLVHVGVIRSDPHAPHRAPARRDRRRDPRGASTSTGRTRRRRRARVRAAQPAHGHGHRPGERHRAADRGASAGCRSASHTPTEVKAAITGYGAADKGRCGRWSRASCGWTRCRSPRMPPTRSRSRSATRGAGGVAGGGGRSTPRAAGAGGADAHARPACVDRRGTIRNRVGGGP